MAQRQRSVEFEKVLSEPLLQISSSDNLMTGAAVCSLFLDVEALFTGGAARWAATFFIGSRFTRLGFFGTSSLRSSCWLRSRGFDIIGHRPPFSKINRIRRRHDGRELLSISTRSGNFSTELILMIGLSIPVRIGSATGCGTNQLTRTATGPERFRQSRSISTRAFDRLHLDTTGKPLFFEES